MSVLIKGMEMPTKTVLFCIHPGGKVFADIEENWREYEAVTVPPHGRLIDADARVNVQIYNDEYEDFQTVNMSIDDLLDCSWIELEDAPTIIPAEEGET